MFLRRIVCVYESTYVFGRWCADVTRYLRRYKNPKTVDRAYHGGRSCVVVSVSFNTRIFALDLSGKWAGAPNSYLERCLKVSGRSLTTPYKCDYEFIVWGGRISFFCKTLRLTKSQPPGTHRRTDELIWVVLGSLRTIDGTSTAFR